MKKCISIQSIIIHCLYVIVRYYLLSNFLLKIEDMFAQLQAPEILPAEQLDEYLHKGWFRMGQTIFTTNFLNFNNIFYSAIWLRISLAEYERDKAQQRLSKLNQHFRTEIKQASIDDEKENLFKRYRETVSFKAAPSVQQLLFGKDSLHNIYNTFELNVYHESKLIACGYFDIGKSSAAGISSFYDPDYKKYSLGKFLIYLKINYCKELGMQYFYPGYFVPGYSYFDYKLKIGKEALSYYNVTAGKWLPIDAFTTENIPLREMHEKLSVLHQLLNHKKIYTQQLYYDFFDANLLPELRNLELFDYPVFLLYFEQADEPFNQLVVYNICDQKYHIIKCRGIWKPDFAESDNKTYSRYLLKSDFIIYSSTHPEAIVRHINGHPSEQSAYIQR